MLVVKITHWIQCLLDLTINQERNTPYNHVSTYEYQVCTNHEMQHITYSEDLDKINLYDKIGIKYCDTLSDLSQSNTFN